MFSAIMREFVCTNLWSSGIYVFVAVHLYGHNRDVPPRQRIFIFLYSLPSKWLLQVSVTRKKKKYWMNGEVKFTLFSSSLIQLRYYSLLFWNYILFILKNSNFLPARRLTFMDVRPNARILVMTPYPKTWRRKVELWTDSFARNQITRHLIHQILANRRC